MSNSKVYTVSQINSYIKQAFARNSVLNNISIEGEITECRYHSSGHIYFTLKDKDTGAQLACTMWRNNRYNLDFELKEGLKVIVTGRIDVYEAKGTYHLNAELIEMAGIGELFLKRKQTAEKLQKEGLFDPEHKKPIPNIIRTLGIITGKGSRAEGDFKRGLSERNPNGMIKVVWAYATMEGDRAPGTIVDAIKRMDDLGLDVIIVGRGGGASETLWSFDDEAVVRAVYAAKTPIISAVGHDMDVPVIDYVADERAGTPSFAIGKAIKITYEEISERLVDAHFELVSKMNLKIEKYRERTEGLKKRIEAKSQRMQLLSKRDMLLATRKELNHGMYLKLSETRRRLVRRSDLDSRMTAKLEDTKNRFLLNAEKLEKLSPVAKITKGFAYVSDGEGKKVASVKTVGVGETLDVTLSDGTITTEVKSVTEKNTFEGF